MARKSVAPGGEGVPLECFELSARNSGLRDTLPGSHCDARPHAVDCSFSGSCSFSREGSKSLTAVEDKSHRSLIDEFDVHHCLKHPRRDRYPQRINFINELLVQG